VKNRSNNTEIFADMLEVSFLDLEVILTFL
jgi:hypothetical protein